MGNFPSSFSSGLWGKEKPSGLEKLEKGCMASRRKLYKQSTLENLNLAPKDLNTKISPNAGTAPPGRSNLCPTYRVQED